MDFTAFLAGASLTAGRIVVLDLNGNIKILAPGQAIAPGELVIETLEETDVPQFRIATDAGETNITDDIQQIFAALEEGQDPTQLGDDFATAAGETGGSSLVAGGTISRTGAESLASTDFSTQGLQALGLNEAQSLSLFDLLNDANTALQGIDSIAPSAPTVTLDTDSGSKADDFLTNDGSYTVTDIEDGATVEYFVDGEWTTTEPATVEGENTIIIRQTDEAGNSSESSTLTFTLDTTAPDAPQISLDTDSGSLADDFLTNKGDFTVAGTEEGATVEYFVNGEWTTTAPTPVEGDNTIIVRQTDTAGNTSGSSTLTFTLDTTAPDAPQISLETDSGSLADDFLTNKGDFTVTGTEEGATVEYFVNGEWTTTAPTPVEGDNKIIVRQTDTAGNTSGSSTLTFTLDTTAPDVPQISLDIDSGSLADDFLTNKGDFTVAGTEEGATVEYSVNGEWTTTAPTPVEGDNTIIVRQTDAAGNTSGSSTLTFTLDTTAPDAPQISLDTDSGSSADDLLTNKGDFTVTGTEESAKVEYFVNGEWTTTAPTPVEGDNTIIVRQTDAAGNTSGSSTLTFTLDTTAQAGTVSVDPITSDDVITETEKNQTITVTGSATGGDIKTGDVVTAIINGKEYTGSVSEDGAWELSVSGSDLAVDTAFEVTVNSTDTAGNEVTSKGESVHRFDDTPINVNIDIDPITSDSVVNAQEVNSLVTVTGTVTGESFSSGVVTLTINGVEYTGEVVNGKYSIEVKGSDLSADSDNVVDAKVDVVNTAGNIGSATSTEFYLVDTFARGTIKIDSITDDNVINKAESEGLVKVTGSVGGDARPGDQVTVVVNGVTYTTSVLSNKTWEVSVSGSDLAQDDKVTATVTGDDWAGNPFSGSGERDYVVDTEIGTDGDDATKAVSIDSITEDTADATDFITSDNQLVISGSVDLAEGDSLTVNFNGTDYTTDNGLSIADGKWTLDVTGTTLADGSYDVTATVTDTAGNSDKAEQTIVVDTEIGTDGDDATKAVSIDSITEDTADATDFITSDNQLVISGSVDLAEGDSLTVNFNGTDYTTDNGLSIADGKWTLDVTGTTLADGSYDVTATVTDTAGNSDKAEQTIVVDTEIGTEIDILNIAGDHKISADESNADVTVVGYVNKDAQPNDKIDFYVNGELIGSGFVSNEPHLDAHGNQIGYKFEFVTKGSNLIPDGEVDGGAILTAKVTVSDVAGNTFVATTTEPYFFDIDAPDAPTITKVTDDSSGSDYSVVTLHGTGSEPGNEVEVFAKDANGVYVTIGTATVQQDLSWTLDISSESAIPVNDNEFLYAKEKDSFGNVSEASDSVHYFHGDYSTVSAESTDDFVLLGSGDDLFKSNQDDANNKLVVDGGAGNDTAELNFASTNASVALNTDGSVTITEANGDVNTFIEFENFKFTDGTKTTSELFAPKVILERDQDDVINSDRSTVGYTITLPVGAVVGAMLTIVIEGVTQSFALEPEHIAAGTISGSIDSGSVVGDELSISAEITYGNQPSHLEFKDSDQLAVNEGPQGNDFVVTLSPDSSVIGFDFETESTADGQQIDVVTDREDDANSTDAKEATISFDSLPVLGTVYVVNSDGSRTEVTKDTVVKVTDKLEYDLHDDVNDKLSFDAQTDFKGVYADDTVTSFVLDSGVIISGGHYTGSRPDTDSSLTPDELFFDNADNEKGLGVGSSELDVSTKDYISVDFSQISQGKTDVLVKEANVTFGSVWGNYNDTSSADAQIHVLVFKDGQVVQEFIYDDDQQPIYDGSGVFTANIKVDGGFDEIRVYTTHGTDNPNNNGNSNVTLQSVEVVDAAVSEEVVYEATDSDKGTDKGTIDFVTDSTETSTNNAPHLADTRFSEVGTEDTEISLNLGALNPTDPDGDAVYISNVSVDPSYGSLVLTHDANGVVTSAVFKPAENKHFDDVPFTVTVSDGHKTDTATVMLEVKAVADAPNVTVVFGDSVTTNVTMDSTLHTKLVNGQVLSEADKAALGVTGVVVEVNRNATGTNGSEVLFGSAQADTMYGKYDNDVFVGGAGDDKIDGDDSWSTTDRDGVDTVIYSGPLSNYTLVNNGDFGGKVDQWAVFDATGKDASARTGTSWELTGDHLYEIERLVFSDAIVTLNPDGTYHVEQITETALNLSASVADRDGSEYLDEVQIKGLPDGTMIIDKDTGETLGGFQDINGEQVWVIDVEGNSTQSINYDNLVVRTPSSEALDVDVHVVAKENSLPQSDAGASTEVNAAVSNDVLADQGGEVPTTLISLVIDSSGSMASKPTGLTESRIEYVLEASIELLKNVKSQQGSESVLVQMIDFDTDATHATNGSSSVWMTVTQAISVLNSALANVDNDNYNGIFDAEGWTNYDQGVDAVMAGYQDATVKGITGDTNDVIYFLSDGAQNQGTIGSDWAAFIKGKDVTAVGVGSEANVPSSGLIQVSGSADNIVYIPDEKLVTDLPKLRPTIGTAGSLLMAVSGDDATEVVIDATKAQVIQMINTDSSVINMPDSLSFSVDSVSNELLVSTLYGDFRIGQDGSYYFQPDSSAPKINTGQSVAFEVLMTVKDVSGVESEQLVTLNVSPNGESNAAATSSFNASTGDDQIRGTDNNDIILGHAGNDVLDGGLGDDLLFGGAGSDLLIGGLGNDILTGGDGADIFKWVDMETARDLVTDFNASQGDKLDLADLFDDMSKADIDTLLADLGSGDNQGAVGDVSIRVSDDASASHLTIVKGGQTLTIDFDGASAADITSSLMDNLNHLKD
ncbi:Ig-like domain-containing protein [Vibrio vulnificus]|uniref:Ig-like domain-containing protein n=1 Tax=Vibrio vulnificus TaxID=672 RepID=UPI0032EAFBE5